MSRLLPIPLLLLPMLAYESQTRADQIPLMIQALGDPNLRQGASIALARLGESAVPALRKSLASENADVRIWSAFTLGEIGLAAKPAVSDLCAALGDADAPLRVAAAKAIGKICDPTAINGLMKVLHDKDQRVRQHVVIALGQIGPAAHPAAQKLIAALSDRHVRSFASDALVRIGPSAIDALVSLAGDNNIRFDVAAIVRKIDSKKAKQAGLDRPTVADLPGLSLVISDVTRTDEEYSTAANSLAVLGPGGFRELIKAFARPAVSRSAANAFAHASPAAVPLLIEVLSHKQAEIRATAADALGQMGQSASAATADLIRVLEDPDRNVRYRAVRALHEFGQKAKSAVPGLSKVILDSREIEATRQWAIKTLVVTLPETHDAVVKALIEASREKQNYGVRQLARQFVKQIDAEAAKAAGIK